MSVIVIPSARRRIIRARLTSPARMLVHAATPGRLAFHKRQTDRDGGFASTRYRDLSDRVPIGLVSAEWPVTCNPL